MNKKYLPILLIELYLCTTLFLFVFGVWNFEIYNQPYFWSWIIIFQCMLLFGYLIGAKTKTKTDSTKNYSFLSIRFMKYYLIINIFMTLLNAIRMSGMSSFNPIIIFQKFLSSFGDFSTVYSNKFSVSTATVYLGNVGTVILISWSFLAYAILPLGLYYYKRFNKGEKSIFIFNVFVTFVGAIVIGTNKRIIDMAILFLLYFFIIYQRKGVLYEKSKNNKKYYFYGLTLIISIMFLANKVVGSRGIGGYWNASFYRLGGIVPIDGNSILLKIFPVSLHSFLAILCSYLSQGYFGFSMIANSKLINLNIGHSSLWIVDKFNWNVNTLQYLAQVEYGWDSREMWSSGYSWIANDFGLVGTAVVMFFIGFIFVRLYKECIEEINPVSFVLLYYFCILILFLPGNLQILQDAYGVIGFITFMILWITSKI